MFDLLIRNGMAADGSGAPAEVRDVAIADGRIVAIEPATDDDVVEIARVVGEGIGAGAVGVGTSRVAASVTPTPSRRRSR